MSPDCDASDLDSAKERRGVFCVAGCDAAPPLDMQERILDQMAKFIEIFVIFSLYFSIFSWGNNGPHPLVFGLLHDGIAVIAPISQQMFCGDSLDQAPSLRAIRSGTVRNNNSDRQTMRIHGHV